MKIFLNNFTNKCRYDKPIQKNCLNFRAQFVNPFERTPSRDIFINPSKQEPYADEKMFNDANMSGVCPELEEALKMSLAGTFYLSHIEANLPYLKSGECGLKDYNETILPHISPARREELKKILEEANITSTQSLIELGKIYKSILNKKTISRYPGTEMIEIYGKLNDPKDLLNFTEMLDYACLKSKFSEENVDFNDVIASMKFFGVKDEKEFFDKFSHLQSEFNNFEDEGDRFNAFEYVRDSYNAKRETMEYIKSTTPVLKDLDIDEFYRQNSDIIDYLYIHNQKSFFNSLRKIMISISCQEKIKPSVLKNIPDIVDDKNPESKISFYEFLLDEELTTTELNAMASQAYYDGIKVSDTIINRSEIVEDLIGMLGVDNVEARAFYACFAHILNAIYNETQKTFTISPTDNLLVTAKEFDIANDKEFAKFYSDVVRNPNKPSKNKKGTQKISQKDIVNFIDLLSFLDIPMVEKYKQDKRYPLYLELKKKKSEFIKVENRIQSELNKQKAHKYFTSTFDVFTNYYDLYLSSKTIEAFVQNAIEIRKEEFKEIMTNESALHITLQYYFEDKNALDEFLNKNEIDLARKTPYDILCKRIITCLFKGKDIEEGKDLAQKLSQSDFILNSKNQLAKFAGGKTEKELQTLLEIVLNQNISSIQDLNALLKPYLNAQKQISKFLAHFKAQNMNFEDYLNRLRQIQKDLDNFGFPLTINEDNIEMVDFSELDKGKLSLTCACNLVNKLLGVQNGNFILGLENSLVQIHPKYSAKQIAKELIYSQTGKYQESYKGFINKYNLDSEDFGFVNPNEEEYQNILQDCFDNNLNVLQRFINSDFWLPSFENGKTPNLGLHARMRLIDRFILQEGKELFSDESIKELQNIINTIYFETPSKMEKAKNSIALYFMHEDYEIKAIFNKEGQMITVAKNKL